MKATVATLIVVTILVGAWITGFIGIHYPHVIQDQPLRHPLAVVRVETNRLWLEDGRVLALDDADGSQISNKLSQSDFKVDIEPGADGILGIYARQKNWICGTPWAQPIRIPIFRDTVYKNRRELIAIGMIEEASSQQSGAANAASPHR
jgi:hypothetical protein